MSAAAGVVALAGSIHPFMGANPYADATGVGVSFRVWAPFATSVAIAGDFNSWSSSANALASEGNGFWSVDVPEAKPGDQYKFCVTSSSAGVLWRMDPYKNFAQRGKSEWRHRIAIYALRQSELLDPLLERTRHL